MKKLMFAAVAALAMVGAANAARYDVFVDCFASPYELDKNPSRDNNGWYSFYVMKQEDAQTAMGATKAVTYNDMAKWLGEDFSAHKASVIANADNVPFYSYSSWDGYNFYRSGNSGSGLGSAIAVAFYDDSKNLAYCAMSNISSSSLKFKTGEYSYTTGWQAASVPEPTSGLLLLLGMAGLALKRKRA